MEKVCTVCLNDTSVRNIKFNEEGLCNYCENYFRDKEKLQDYDTLNKLFVERLELIKGKHKYDVAVGISGGKDSVFVLHQLKTKYNLKIKAFTMNNGFLSEEAKKNIDSIVKEFDVEHEYINFDSSLLKKFYAYSIKKWLVPCVACSYIGYASMINFASKIDAGMIVHGRSPEQMFRMYGEDVFTELVSAGLKSIKDLDLNDLYTRLLLGIDEKLDENLKNDVKNMLFKDIVGKDFREFVAYFLYHPYNEKEIVSFLRENTSWSVGEHYNHYDCRIHQAAKYIYQCAEGRAHILAEVSFLIRDGQISIEEAKEKLKGEILSKKPKKEMDELFGYINKKEYSTIFKAKAYRIYRSKWK